jgi:hypothetical protein
VLRQPTRQQSRNSKSQAACATKPNRAEHCSDPSTQYVAPDITQNQRYDFGLPPRRFATDLFRAIRVPSPKQIFAFAFLTPRIPPGSPNGASCRLIQPNRRNASALTGFCDDRRRRDSCRAGTSSNLPATSEPSGYTQVSGAAIALLSFGGDVIERPGGWESWERFLQAALTKNLMPR